MLDAGMHDEARAVYARILEFDPQNAAARSAISAVTRLTRPKRFRRPSPSRPPLTLSGRGHGLYEEGRWQEAIQRFSLVKSMAARLQER